MTDEDRNIALSVLARMERRWRKEFPFKRPYTFFPLLAGITYYDRHSSLIFRRLTSLPKSSPAAKLLLYHLYYGEMCRDPYDIPLDADPTP